MVTAYLGLGSNLGDRRALLNKARRALDQTPQVRLAACSPLYETEPVGGPPGQKPYLNAVLAVRTTLSARALLERCLEIETRCGRMRSERWGPRTLDLDLLFYGNQVLTEPNLTVPHPRLHERRFVLVPLCDIAPDLVHPLLGRTVCELLSRLEEREKTTLAAARW